SLVPTVITLFLRLSTTLSIPPTSPLFPYPTLFRSHAVPALPAPGPRERQGPLLPGRVPAADRAAGRRLPARALDRRLVLHREERSEEDTSALQSPDHLVCRRPHGEKHRCIYGDITG